MSDSRKTSDKVDFVFVESPADFHDPTAIMVRLPPGIRSKQKLFAIFAHALRFPRYFGWNWDAFEECLSDRSWLQPKKPVVIVHQDLPFGPGGQNRGIYLDILRSANNLQIVMPQSLQTTLSPAANTPR